MWARRSAAILGRPDDVQFVAALALVIVSVALGGASQGNALAQAAVELASLPLLAVAIWRLWMDGIPEGAGLPILLLVAVMAVPLLQLVPIPVSVWMELPTGHFLQRVLASVHLATGPRPYSLAPEATWRAFLALLPPAAMFLAILHLPESRKRALGGAWLILAVLSLLLGVLQVLRGANSPLYLYAITNFGSPVGFFANRNHQAEFLLCLLPIAAVLASRFRFGSGGRLELSAGLAALYFPLAIAGVAATLSRAGIALTCVSVLGSLAILWSRRVRSNWWPGLTVAAISAAAIGAVVLLNFSPILARFAENSPDDLRFEGWPIVLHTGWQFLPFGSGLGSFDTIYRSVEPLSQVSTVYFNHAHNDYAELWLEVGLAGIILLTIFLIWLVARTIGIWTTSARTGRISIAMGCSIAIALLLSHSAVDYPLRTEALSVLFAFACAALRRTSSPTL